MILPDGYSDVPRGKIAAVVTHLEMLQCPALPPDPDGAWALRHVHAPGLAWFRDLYRRVGEDWLWFSRLRMSDTELAAIIRAPRVEVYALMHDGRDEGLLELDFREPGQCELSSTSGVSKSVICAAHAAPCPCGRMGQDIAACSRGGGPVADMRTSMGRSTAVRSNTASARSAATRDRKLKGWVRAVKGVLGNDNGE